jgi:hypothetical protein
MHPNPAGHIAYQRGDVLYVLADPASFQDDRVRLAIGLRNEATLAGRCPVCGARGPNRAERRRARGVETWAMRHAAECPCSDESLRRLAAETGKAA